MEDRSYDRAIAILSSLIQFKSRADSLNWRDAFENMEIYMDRIGLTHESLRAMQIIHVAGTKGKGSTVAMCESILRSSGYRTGLFTSPHLMDVRERIRVNGCLVEKDVFLQHFWESYDLFKAKATAEVGIPGYFRFMTLLALKIFGSLELDVIILEVGIGGRLDATNLIKLPVVCGITSLGMDHMEMLGNTISLIAKEKAGIMKIGCPTFSSPQPPDATEALLDSARNVGTSVEFVPSLHECRLKDDKGIAPSIALGGYHMNINAGLAVRLAIEWERRSDKSRADSSIRSNLIDSGILPPSYIKGLETVHWPGRSQIVESDEACSDHPGVSFFIDGAHTPESMEVVADWFSSESLGRGSDYQRVLLFNCMKERDPSILLPALSLRLRSRGISFHKALFVPPESKYGHLPGVGTSRSKDVSDVSWQLGMKSIWEEKSLGSTGSQPSAVIHTSLHVAMDWLRDKAKTSKIHVLCTGSLYLVGDLLRLLKKKI